MKSNITTGQGDAGRTTALDGSAVDKSHPIMNAVGTLDALRAQTALLRLQLQEKCPEELSEINFLLFLLRTFFLIGTAISDPHGRKPECRHSEITQEHLERLESEQERLESGLQLPRAFIVSATNIVSAQADITASAARTFERSLVALCQTMPDFNNPICLAFANRLSDYFFVLARHIEKGHHHPVNYSSLDEL